MGREDYLVTAGIGFDLDRSSAKKSIGIFEGIMGTLNAVSTKAAKDDYAAADAAYGKSLKDIEKKEKTARKNLDEGVKKSAKSAQAALDASKMKPPSRAPIGALGTGGRTKKNLKKYREAYNENNRMMKKSYGKFAKEAKAMGIEMAKGTKLKLDEFGKQDVEDRKRLINLNKRMVKDEKDRLKNVTKGSKGYKNLKKEIKHLETQQKAMINVSEDAYQLERKEQNIKRKGAKDERKANVKRLTTQKKIVAGLKNQQAAYKRIGQLASGAAGKIKAGMQNAFVIGTAAATAFFMKMQPLNEAVQEFEKTIINANSVFNVSKKELHEVSDSMVKFTLKYGVSAQDTATGLYQLASAGLSAAESQTVLQHTMKLAMATQGDHNTLAKLTVQTIMGFGMEMEETEMLTDKFAHSIQKSLIEWQDLASSVKFAMPFFVATGQSIDELLGGLEVLTNRALEAGIAGRGLRQALAQFAKHADDNSSALRKMGVEIMDAEGNMRALSDIAMDAKMAFGDVTDLEALTAMLEDMNVRGATAFALLVQNAGEYKEAVGDLANSAGEATQMADIQQQSLANQIQLVKNALLAPFLLTDEIGTANNTLNEFTHRMTQLVQEFTEFFIVILPDGTEELTEHSQALKDFVIHALGVAVEMIQRLKDVFLESNEGFESFTTLLDLAVVPMHLMLDILDKLGPNFLAYYIQFKLYTSLLPIMAVFGLIATVIQMKMMAAMIGNAGATEVLTASQKRLGIAMGALNSKGKAYTMQQYQNTAGTWAFNHALVVQTGTNKRLAMSWKAVFISMMLVFALFAGAVLTTGKLSDALMILAAGVALLAIALNFLDAVKKLGWYGIPVAMAGMAVILTGMHMARKAIQSHLGIGQASGVGETISMGGSGGIVGMGSARTMDSGGTYLPSYDNGGPTTEHGMAWLQKGETVNSKTANMLEGGITLNTGDVHVQDGEDFANRVAEALPAAIRRVSDTGGI